MPVKELAPDTAQEQDGDLTGLAIPSASTAASRSHDLAEAIADRNERLENDVIFGGSQPGPLSNLIQTTSTQEQQTRRQVNQNQEDIESVDYLTKQDIRDREREKVDPNYRRQHTPDGLTASREELLRQNGAQNPDLLTSTSQNPDALARLTQDVGLTVDREREIREIEIQERQRERAQEKEEKKGNWFSRFGKKVGDVSRSVVEVGKGAVEMAGDAVGAVVEKVKPAAETVVRKAKEYVEDPSAIVDDVKERASQVAEKFEEIKETASERISEIKEFFSSEEFAKIKEKVGEFVGDKWDKVTEVASSVKDKVTSGDWWKAQGAKALNGLKNAAVATKDFAVLAVTDPKAAWEKTKNAAIAVKDKVVELAPVVWDKVKGAAIAIKDMAVDVYHQIGLHDLVMGTFNLGKGLLWDLPKNIGGDIINLGKDLGKVWNGELTPEELKERMKERAKETAREFAETAGQGLRMMKGAAIMAAEFTGLADVYYAGKYAWQGKWGMAAMHAGFAVASAGAIVATVATAGAGIGALAGVAAGRMSVKKALQVTAKKGFQAVAEEFGERSVKELSVEAASRVIKDASPEAIQQLSKEVGGELAEKVTREVAQTGAVSRELLEQVGDRVVTKRCIKLGEDVADQGLERLGKIVKEGGELSLELAEKQLDELADPLAEKAFLELGLDTVAERLAIELRQDLLTKNSDELVERLVKRGAASDATAARHMVKEMKKALKKGKFDQIEEILEEGMVKHLKRDILDRIEPAFKARFRKGLMGELDDEYSKVLREHLEKQAKKLGKEVDELADDYVKAGWKGARRGITRAMRRVIRKGLRRGLRGRRVRPRPIMGRRTQQGAGAAGAMAVAEHVDDLRDEGGYNEATQEKEQTQEYEKSVSQVYTVTEGDKTYLISRSWDDRNQRWNTMKTLIDLETDNDSGQNGAEVKPQSQEVPRGGIIKRAAENE